MKKSTHDIIRVTWALITVFLFGFLLGTYAQDGFLGKRDNLRRCGMFYRQAFSDLANGYDYHANTIPPYEWTFGADRRIDWLFENYPNWYDEEE